MAENPTITWPKGDNIMAYILETGDKATLIHMTLPGVKAHNVKIEVRSGIGPTIYGGRHDVLKFTVLPDENALTSVGRNGKLETLNFKVDTYDWAQASSTLADGVLTLTIPLLEAASENLYKIPINGGGGGECNP
jgi:HSP20 family molecular chaperone IbpA